MTIPTLTPTMMLQAYAAGIFPMAEGRLDQELLWFDPPVRAILPLDAFHCPRSLGKVVRQKPFEIRFDTDFAGVIAGCALAREDTWINATIQTLFTELHRMGFAHSVEAWQDDQLVGGLYGAAIGSAFFGESMFSRQSNASKVCLVHLVEKLREDGFSLLDVQFRNDHLSQFGIIEIPRKVYKQKLAAAIAQPQAWRKTKD